MISKIPEGGYVNKDPAKHSPQDPSKALMIEKYIEKCGNMKTETESRSQAIKQEKTLAIKRAQTSARRRRKMNKAKPEVAVWIEGHLEQQKRKIARFNEKKENRAKPNGKRYIPALDNKFDSSETYDSDSEDSVQEVLWNPQKPWAPPGPRNLDADQAPNSAKDLQKSIKERIRETNPRDANQNRKEGCTCPDGKCKWLGDCLSPK